MLQFQGIEGFGELFQSGVYFDAGIVQLLFSDSAHHVPGVVVPWVDSGLVRQGIDLILDGVVEFLGRSLLEVRATGFADQERISGKYHILDNQTDTSVCMPGSREDLYGNIPDRDNVSVIRKDIRFRNGSTGSHDDSGSGFLAEESASGDVVRMNVGIEYMRERESELRYNLDVPLDLIPDWVYDECLSGFWVSDDIGIGPGFLVEKLAKYESIFHRKKDK